MALKINKRDEWSRDRGPRPLTEQSTSNIREFFIHHPASPHDLDHIDKDQEQVSYMRAIRDFHMDDPTRRWAYFAYNFAVFQDGEVYQGRGLGHVPAAQLGHNTNTIAVLCVLGNSELPSTRMKEGLRDLKNHCDKECGRDLRALGHSQGAGQSTECPGTPLRNYASRLNTIA